MRCVKTAVVVLLVAVIVAIPIIACASAGNEKKTETSMFVTVESGWDKPYKVVYQVDTKVMYAVSDSSYNLGNFTVLVNPDGTPQLWEGK